ncbi:unnamed protein product [Diatraea saccharalis]|uniref:Uncharacterized protein n=1 Tax=Diatraea saccharalis TaxID=40085 RepID=A0A9N9N4K8_9NEOP|nr:unnamed protein product [Diatraea saccharalis]
MTPEPQIIGHHIKFANTLIGTFKKACWHIPEIVGATALALVGIGMAGIGLYNYDKNDGDNREYKWVYTVVRSTDPRACKLKNPVYTQY